MRYECKHGDKKAGHVCVNGFWRRVGRADSRKPVTRHPDTLAAHDWGGIIPGYLDSDPRLTQAQADYGYRMGYQAYVKFDLPLLDMLPGIPYAPWMLILPGFKLTGVP